MDLQANAPLRLIFALVQAALLFGLLHMLTKLSQAFLPKIVTRYKNRYRKRAIVTRLPHALDLIALSLRSGATLPAALHQLAKTPSLGKLQQEMQQLVAAIHAGRPLTEALDELVQRVDTKEMRLVSEALIVSYRSGGSVATSLNQLADRFLEDRLHKMEAHAIRLPIYLMAPLILFIFPSCFLILFFPILYRIVMLFSG